MMNHFEAKHRARVDRLNEKVDKAQSTADAAYSRSCSILAPIPPG